MNRLECEKVFRDVLSGKSTERPGLQEMMNYIRSGDVVYVESISRLARSTRDLLRIIDDFKDKGVEFVSEKESINTTTAQGRFVLTIFAALAELERESILQRQAEGIALAKERGTYKGRLPKKIDEIELDNLLKRWKDGDITQQYICKKLGISRSTLFRRIREHEGGNK